MSGPTTAQHTAVILDGWSRHSLRFRQWSDIRRTYVSYPVSAALQKHNFVKQKQLEDSMLFEAKDPQI